MARQGLAPAGLPHQSERDHVAQRQDVTHAQDRGPRRRQHVPDLELGIIVVLAPRHAVESHDELRQEREEEADENDDRGHPRPPSEYIRPVIFGHQ